MITSGRGIWTSEIVTNDPVPSDPTHGPVQFHARRPWPALQVGDTVQGHTVFDLDADSLHNDTPIWFSEAGVFQSAGTGALSNAGTTLLLSRSRR